MLTAYFVALVVGGVLVATSMVLGGKGPDADADADLDAGLHLDVDADAHLDHGAAGHDTVDDVGQWLPFFSLRFWTFFAAFFGLTGVVFTLLLDISWVATLLSSLGVGFVAGYMVAWMIRRVKVTQTDSSVAEAELEGATARVLLPVSDARGKVRVNIKGSSIDIAARTHDGSTIEHGEEVLVVRIGDGEALVTGISADSGDSPRDAN